MAYQTRFEVYVWAPTRSAAERPRDQLILSQKSKALINQFLERRRQFWSVVKRSQTRNFEAPWSITLERRGQSDSIMNRLGRYDVDAAYTGC